MSRKHVGHRALGNATPEMRSLLIHLSRSLASLSHTQRSYPLPNEQEVARAPGLQQQRGFSAGGRSTPVVFGKESDKPTSNFLQVRGTGAFVYVAQDTNKVWIWNGVSYKSSVFT